MKISRREFLAGCAALAAGGFAAIEWAQNPKSTSADAGGVAFGQTSFASQPPEFDRVQMLFDQSALGRPIRLTQTLYNFHDEPEGDEAWLLTKGVTPIVNCFGRLKESDYPGNRAIAAGDYDAQISRWADALGSLSGKVLLRPMREMNHSFAPWYTTVQDEYIDAWRHIHGLFRGASNVAFIWCPASAGAAYESWYPGDDYVDICGIDGYARVDNWQSFRDLFAPFYVRCNAKDGTLTRKPTMVCETNAEVSSDQLTYDRASFFAEIVPTLKSSFPLISGLCIWVDGNYPAVHAAGSKEYLSMAHSPYLGGAIT
jgi:Glycosyl hydrolase family 26